MHPFMHGRYPGSGQGHAVIAEAGLDGVSQYQSSALPGAEPGFDVALNVWQARGRDFHEKHREFHEQDREFHGQDREFHESARDFHEIARDFHEHEGNFYLVARDFHDPPRGFHDLPHRIGA
jgi:hypothetical protein